MLFEVLALKNMGLVQISHAEELPPGAVLCLFYGRVAPFAARRTVAPLKFAFGVSAHLCSKKPIKTIIFGPFLSFLLRLYVRFIPICSFSNSLEKENLIKS